MPPKQAATPKPTPAKPASSTSKGKRTFTPRPPRSKEDRLPKLYLGLTEQVENGHFDGAIRTCKTILRLDANSLPAFQTLLFLHLQIDDYAAALELVSSPPEGAGELQFEKAYCLYRLHREAEALEGLDKIGSKGRKEQHLDAQIRYRLGEYEKAQQEYDVLLAQCDPSSSEHPDIVQNMSATSSHLDFLGHSYHSYLSDPTSGYQPTESELEINVPTLPTGWATGGPSTVKAGTAAAKVAAPASLPKSEGKKRKHKLPKGASEAKKANEDPDRWLPLRQRASYINAQSKKKGGNQSMGVGMTQGSSSHGNAAGGGGGGGNGGGNKKKKGKK